MHYIVLDLEWNQPTSFNTPVFRQIGDSLLFEVIQIGAVKLDDQFTLLDELSIPIRPTHYTTHLLLLLFADKAVDLIACNL